MNIKLISDRKLWDSFVDTSPNALLFHKWEFLNLVKKHSGSELCRYGIYKGSTLISICPLFYNKSKGLKTIFSPPPMSAIPCLGPALSPNYYQLTEHKKETYLMEIIDAICNKIKEYRPNYVSIILTSDFLDTRAFMWQGYNIYLDYTYIINLEKSVEEIWNSFNRNCNKQIKSMPSYVTLHESLNVEPFYDMLNDRYKEQGLNLTIFNSNYLKDIIDLFPNNIKLHYLNDDNENIVGVQVTYNYKSKYMFWMGGAKPHSDLHCNEYLTWEFIKRAKGENFKEFELSGAGTKRLCEYKSKFHPSLKVYYRVTKTDHFGRLAEWSFKNFVKKNWIEKAASCIK